MLSFSSSTSFPLTYSTGNLVRRKGATVSSRCSKQQDPTSPSSCYIAPRLPRSRGPSVYSPKTSLARSGRFRKAALIGSIVPQLLTTASLQDLCFPAVVFLIVCLRLRKLNGVPHLELRKLEFSLVFVLRTTHIAIPSTYDLDFNWYVIRFLFLNPCLGGE